MRPFSFANLSVAVALLAASAAPSIAAVFITNAGTGGFVEGGNSPSLVSSTGWRITTGTRPLVVSALGTWDKNSDGLESSMLVGVWETSSQTLLGKVSVPAGTAGTLNGQFRYADLATPVLLQANTSYTFGSRPELGGGAGGWWYINRMATGQTVSADATVTDATLDSWEALPYATAVFADQMPDTNIGGDAVLTGPNFSYTIARVVPEPASAVALLSAVAGGLVRRRRPY